MKLKFQKHELPNTVNTIKTISVKTEKEAIKIVLKNKYPDGTTAICLINEKTGKEGYFYRNTDNTPAISWWSGRNWQEHKNAFKGKKSFPDEP